MSNAVLNNGFDDILLASFGLEDYSDNELNNRPVEPLNNDLNQTERDLINKHQANDIVDDTTVPEDQPFISGIDHPDHTEHRIVEPHEIIEHSNDKNINTNAVSNPLGLESLTKETLKLFELRDVLLYRKSINRQVALECLDYLPKPYNNPKHYTEQFSLVNYQAATEGIFESIWKYLKKFFEMIAGLFKKNKSDTQTIKTNTKKAEKDVETIIKEENEVTKPPTNTSKSLPSRSIRDLFVEEYDRYKEKKEERFKPFTGINDIQLTAISIDPKSDLHSIGYFFENNKHKTEVFEFIGMVANEIPNFNHLKKIDTFKANSTLINEIFSKLLVVYSGKNKSVNEIKTDAEEESGVAKSLSELKKELGLTHLRFDTVARATNYDNTIAKDVVGFASGFVKGGKYFQNLQEIKESNKRTLDYLSGFEEQFEVIAKFNEEICKMNYKVKDNSTEDEKAYSDALKILMIIMKFCTEAHACVKAIMKSHERELRSATKAFDAAYKYITKIKTSDYYIKKYNITGW